MCISSYKISLDSYDFFLVPTHFNPMMSLYMDNSVSPLKAVDWRLESWLPASSSALKVSCPRLALVISSNLGREFIDWEGLAHDLVLGPGYHADHTYNLLYLERSSCRLLLRDVSHVHTVCVESSLAKRKKTEKQTNSKQLQYQPTQILTIKKKHTHTIPKG